MTIDVEDSAPHRRAPEEYIAEGVRTVCLVPLVGGDEPLGLLGLYHRHTRTWPQEEVALVQAFADQAAVAIQNARLYRSVAAQAARMRSIQDLSSRLNRLTDVRAIGEAIVAEASALAEYHDIRIYRVDWERMVCDPIAFTREMLDGDPEDAEALLRVAVGEGFTGWVAEHGEPLLINDALDDERGKTIDGTDDIPESMLVVPMLYEGRALGVIVLSQLGFNRFTDDDLQTMSIFAGYAAQAMANATSYEQLVGSRASSPAVPTRSVVCSASTSGCSRRSTRRTCWRRSPTACATWWHTTTCPSTAPTIAASHGPGAHARAARRRGRPVHIPFGHGLMGWAVEHSQPILANDALSDPRALQIPGTPPDPEAVVVVPLVADRDVLGALNVSRSAARRCTSARATSSSSSSSPHRPRSRCATPTRTTP